MTCYAHTAETETGEPLSQEHWQPLSNHLRNVADKAREFEESLDLADAAELAGLLHDLGKYRDPTTKSTGFSKSCSRDSSRPK